MNTISTYRDHTEVANRNVNSIYYNYYWNTHAKTLLTAQEIEDRNEFFNIKGPITNSGLDAVKVAFDYQDEISSKFSEFQKQLNNIQEQSKKDKIILEDKIKTLEKKELDFQEKYKKEKINLNSKIKILEQQEVKRKAHDSLLDELHQRKLIEYYELHLEEKHQNSLINFTEKWPKINQMLRNNNLITPEIHATLRNYNNHSKIIHAYPSIEALKWIIDNDTYSDSHKLMANQLLNKRYLIEFYIKYLHYKIQNFNINTNYNSFYNYRVYYPVEVRPIVKKYYSEHFKNSYHRAKCPNESILNQLKTHGHTVEIKKIATIILKDYNDVKNL